MTDKELLKELLKGGGMEIIKLTNEQVKYLTETVERNYIAKAAFQEASFLIRKTNQEIWNIIKKLFPDKTIERGELNWEDKEIIIRKS